MWFKVVVYSYDLLAFLAFGDGSRGEAEKVWRNGMGMMSCRNGVATDFSTAGYGLRNSHLIYLAITNNHKLFFTSSASFTSLLHSLQYDSTPNLEASKHNTPNCSNTQCGRVIHAIRAATLSPRPAVFPIRSRGAKTGPSQRITLSPVPIPSSSLELVEAF